MPRYRVAVPEIYVHYEEVNAPNRGLAMKSVARGQGTLVEDNREGTSDLIGLNDVVNGKDLWQAVKISENDVEESPKDVQMVMMFE